MHKNLSEIYRCPKCDQTASEWMWDESTEQYLRDRFNKDYSFTKIKDAKKIPAVSSDYGYKCAYCGSLVKLGEMDTTQTVKIQRTGHLDEDLFTL